MIHKGDKVRIKPEWQDEGDADLHWIAMDNEEKGRVTIATEEDTSLPILPLQTVNVDMLETTTKGD